MKKVILKQNVKVNDLKPGDLFLDTSNLKENRFKIFQVKTNVKGTVYSLVEFFISKTTLAEYLIANNEFAFSRELTAQTFNNSFFVTKLTINENKEFISYEIKLPEKLY